MDYRLLNEHVSESEKIISSDYQFEFENLDDNSENITQNIAAIIKARVLVEGICRFIVLYENLVKDEKDLRTATLELFISKWIRPSLVVAPTILSDIRVVQEKSNLAAHFQVQGKLTSGDANICISSLFKILDWFVGEYHDSSTKKISNKVNCDFLKKTGNVPPKVEGCIHSRGKDVKSIHNILSKKHYILITGETGIGKTEVVKDYVSQFGKKYEGINYVENVDNIQEYLFNLPIAVKNKMTKSKNEIIEDKTSSIHSLDIPFLFIIDNFSGSISDLDSFVPQENDEYYIIVTSNTSSCECESNKVKNEEKYKISAFSDKESLEIFQYFYKKNFDESKINHLIELLEYNPRAIKLSAIFLNDSSSFSIDDLVREIDESNSIENILQTLYFIITRKTVLESSDIVKELAQFLSIIPYNGVELERFKELFFVGTETKFGLDDFETGWISLLKTRWVSIDENDLININPILSDVIFEKTNPNFMDLAVVRFLEPILKPISKIRDLYLPQIINIKPFIDQLYKRITLSERCEIDILKEIREFYIALYDVEKVQVISDYMEKEYEYFERYGGNKIENAIYRQGISRFNLEDFTNAHEAFERALNLLDNKIIKIKEDIARICAYEGTSLAAIGKGQEAIKCAKRSISLRKEIGKLGNIDAKEKLWVSYYNFARVYISLEMFEEAEIECEEAIKLYAKSNPKEFKDRTGTDYSSLIQTKGRIYMGLKKYEEAIENLEQARIIRETLKASCRIKNVGLRNT